MSSRATRSSRRGTAREPFFGAGSGDASRRLARPRSRPHDGARPRRARPRAESRPTPACFAAYFGANTPVGSEVGEGNGLAYTDFKVHEDGCSRILVLDRRFSAFQAGRTLQRLFEIEAYRMLALLSLPIARAQSPKIAAIERSLATRPTT